MFKKLVNILILSFLCCFINSQNLVPNYNFEKAWTCPQHFTTYPIRELVPNWINPTRGTPDYFHVCSDSIAGIPDNFAGSMYPFEGRAYVGLILREVFDSTHKNNVFGISREYIQAELAKPLVKNKIYCVSLYYAHASKSLYAVDALGIAITRQSISTRDAGKILQKPQIINRPGRIMQNKTYWKELCGIYRARGNEKFITIGNFLNNEQTNYKKNTDEFVDSNFVYAYYYIDAVRVFEIENHFECGCNEIDSFGIDMLAENYDPNTGYNSKNYSNIYQKKSDDVNGLALNNFDFYLISEKKQDSLLKLLNIDKEIFLRYYSIFNNISETKLNDLLINYGFDIDSFFEDPSNFYSLSDVQRNELLQLLGLNLYFYDNSFLKDLSDTDLYNLLRKYGFDKYSLNNSINISSMEEKEFNNLLAISGMHSYFKNIFLIDSLLKLNIDSLLIMQKFEDLFGSVESSITEEAFENITIGDVFTLNRIYFEFDSDELLTASFIELNNLSEILKNKKNLKIEIRGHTDNIGSNSYNRKLSNDRALAVYNYLIEKGIKSNRMKYTGYGSRKPIADNQTSEGRALNRRVEIVIIDL